MNTTGILKFLREHPGSYIQHRQGDYQVVGADGSPVEGFKPVRQQIDDLVDASHIRNAGYGRYVLV